MNTLALDLGATTGFACGEPGKVISGSFSLKPTRFESASMRFIKLERNLADMLAAAEFGMVYFEEVRRHIGTDAAHAYGGYLATLQVWCEKHKIPYAGVPVQTIKKFWTGKGNASKQEMMDEAVLRGFEPDDDNEADALALLHYVCAEPAQS